MSQAPSALPDRRYTVAEYIAMEQVAVDRHMYLEGRIVPIASGTGPYAIIMSNVAGGCTSALAGKPCRHVDSNLAVKFGRRANYGYTDGLIVCRPLKYDPTNGDQLILLNPTVVFEVLSPSNERFDRGEKFAWYREIESFREYVLITQGKPLVETFTREEDGAWRIATYEDLDARVPLRSVGIELAMRTIYADVDFAAAERPEPTSTTKT